MHTADVVVRQQYFDQSKYDRPQDDPVLAKGNDVTNAPELLLATGYSDFSGQSLTGQISLGLADFSRPLRHLALSYLLPPVLE